MRRLLERLHVDSRFIAILLHFRNYFSANIAQRALGFISLPVMTRLLVPGEYGIVSVFMSYLGILVVILSVNAHTSIGRYWYERKDDFAAFMGTSLCLVAPILVVSFIVFMAFRESLSHLFSLSTPLVILLLPFIMVNIVASVFRQVYEPQRKSGLIAKLSVTRAYLGFGVAVALVLTMEGQRYYGIIWGQLIVGIAVSCIMIVLLVPHFKVAFSPRHMRYILSYSVPLIPYALSGVILAQFDRIMINSYIGSDAAGLYSVAYSIGMLLSLANTALLAAWTPDYFAHMDSRDYGTLDADIDRIFRLILITAMFLILFGQDVGFLLADAKYHVGLRIVPIVVFGYIFHALFQIWGRNIGYARKTIWAPIISFIAGFSNIGLNIIFIPKYGYVAGAYTTVASYMLMAFMGWAVSKYIVQLHTTPLRIVGKPFCILLGLYGAELVFARIEMAWWAMIGVKTIIFFIFCGTMVGRHIPGLFRNVTVTEP